MSGLTLDEAQTALSRCDKIELEILRDATPHEAALMLEAKFCLDATIRDPHASLTGNPADFFDPRAWMDEHFA